MIAPFYFFLKLTSLITPTLNAVYFHWEPEAGLRYDLEDHGFDSFRSNWFSKFDVILLPCNSIMMRTNFIIRTCCTIFMYCLLLLHVSAIKFGHLQGSTSLFSVYV